MIFTHRVRFRASTDSGDMSHLFQMYGGRGGLAMKPKRSISRVAGVVCLVALWAGIPPVRCDILTVGPGGEHAAIQAAVDDAIARSGDHEIRIAQGIFTESVLLSGVGSHLDLSGGWSDAFSSRADDPARTVVSGDNTNRVFDLTGTTGHIRIENLTVTEGLHDQRGAGIHVQCGTCSVELAQLALRDNVVTSFSICFPRCDRGSMQASAVTEVSCPCEGYSNASGEIVCPGGPPDWSG